MIRFGSMSITLLVCAVQGMVLAGLLWRTSKNQEANRWLAVLIVAVVLLMTPYIIGYAGFYDRWPQLSFAPLSYTLAFGPLVYCHTAALIGARKDRLWLHFAPVALQFFAYAAVFPFPLAAKNKWNALVHAPVIDPLLECAALASITAYGIAAYRLYLGYCEWLGENRTDGVEFEPNWIRNFLAALAFIVVIWTGFVIAKWADPARDYFDQFPLYIGFSVLVLYLGIGGWRHSETSFPKSTVTLNPHEPLIPATAVPAERDWAAQGNTWLERIEAEQLWRDPALTLAGLARIFGTNTTYLSRGLGAAAGENFNAIINHYRVAEMQRLLASLGEQRNLLTLAFEVGFNSKASFNRAFQDFAGMSPSAWRLKSQKLLAI